LFAVGAGRAAVVVAAAVGRVAGAESEGVVEVVVVGAGAGAELEEFLGWGVATAVVTAAGVRVTVD
jgi:hypothetical protein